MRTLLKSMTQCISSLNAFEVNLIKPTAIREKLNKYERCGWVSRSCISAGLRWPRKETLHRLHFGGMCHFSIHLRSQTGIKNSLNTQWYHHNSNNISHIYNVNINILKTKYRGAALLPLWMTVMLWAPKMKSMDTQGHWREEVNTMFFFHQPFSQFRCIHPSCDHALFTFASWNDWSEKGLGTARSDTSLTYNLSWCHTRRT